MVGRRPTLRKKAYRKLNLLTVPTPAVKVAPEVMDGRFLRRVSAIYPSSYMRLARVQGLIYLDVVISSCGTVISTMSVDDGRQINAAALGDSAKIAVKKWLYKPYLVNGHAIPVKTRIAVKVSSDEPDGAVTYPNGPATP